MTAVRAALIGLMDRYLCGLLDPFVSLLKVHKLMYFMQAAREPLKLDFERAAYGPYAQNLGHVLHKIEGVYVTGYGAGGDAPNKLLELLPGALESAREVIAGNGETQRRFESAFGLELLATVHWLLEHDGVASDEDLVAETYAWGERKRRFSKQQILLAREGSPGRSAKSSRRGGAAPDQNSQRDGHPRSDWLSLARWA